MFRAFFLFSFSQSLHNRKNLKQKAGEAKDTLPEAGTRLNPARGRH
jgi:hypothetical protein